MPSYYCLKGRASISQVAVLYTMQALSALRSAFGGLSIRDCSRSAQELEVVEVKNACPYRQVTTVTKKGRAKLSYVLADGGPHNRVRTTSIGTGAGVLVCSRQSSGEACSDQECWRAHVDVCTLLERLCLQCTSTCYRHHARLGTWGSIPERQLVLQERYFQLYRQFLKGESLTDCQPVERAHFEDQGVRQHNNTGPVLA